MLTDIEIINVSNVLIAVTQSLHSTLLWCNYTVTGKN